MSRPVQVLLTALAVAAVITAAILCARTHRPSHGGPAPTHTAAGARASAGRWTTERRGFLSAPAVQPARQAGESPAGG